MVDPRELAELVVGGLGMHHAGMLRSDRNLVERLFRDGVIKVLPVSVNRSLLSTCHTRLPTLHIALSHTVAANDRTIAADDHHAAMMHVVMCVSNCCRMGARDSIREQKSACLIHDRFEALGCVHKLVCPCLVRCCAQRRLWHGASTCRHTPSSLKALRYTTPRAASSRIWVSHCYARQLTVLSCTSIFLYGACIGRKFFCKSALLFVLPTCCKPCSRFVFLYEPTGLIHFCALPTKCHKTLDHSV